MGDKRVNTIPLVDIRERLIDTRKKNKISKDAMAVMCGVSGLTYYRWESGATKSITKENYDNLCEVLSNLENNI